MKATVNNAKLEIRNPKQERFADLALPDFRPPALHYADVGLRLPFELRISSFAFCIGCREN